MAIRFCSGDVVCIEKNSISTAFLWNFFVSNDVNTILVINDNGQFYGISTYKMLLYAQGDLNKCIDTHKVYVGNEIFDECKKIWEESEAEYISVINRKEELIYFAYNDKSLDEYITYIEVLERQPQWYFEEILADTIYFVDFNEITYKIYLYALQRNIEVYVDGEKWYEILGIKRRLQEWRKCIFLGEEEKTEYKFQFGIKNSIKDDYLFLKEIVTINILMDMNRTLYKMDENDNYHDVKKRIRDYHITIDLIQCRYASFIKYFCEEEFANVLEIIQNITNKKIFGILANCQGEILYNMVKDVKEFKERYYIVEFTPIWKLKPVDGIESISEVVLNKFDVFIYQYVKMNSMAYSAFASELILNSLKSDCVKICIPNLYFTGYFPQDGGARAYNDLILNAEGINPVFRHIDTCIEREYSKYHSIQKVIEVLKDIHFISEEKIRYNLYDSLQNLKEREKECDIIMSDYIQENYAEKRIFTEPHHPTNEVLMELLN